MTITYYVNEIKHDAFGATDVQTARALFQASYELATGRKAGQEELEDGRYTSDQLSRPRDGYAEFTDNVNGLRRPLYTLKITEQDIEN